MAFALFVFAVLLGVVLRKSHGSLGDEDADDGFHVGVLRGSNLPAGAAGVVDHLIVVLNAAGGSDQLDLGGERVSAERDDSLGDLVADNHADHAQDDVHGAAALVLLVHLVVHPRLDEGVSESQVVVFLKLVPVPGVLGRARELSVDGHLL